MKNATTIRFRPVGSSAMERVAPPTTCQCCGREELKKTVKVESLDGLTTLWMGVGCAAKACGMGVKEYGKAADVAQKAQDDAERAAWRAEDAKFQAWLDAACPALRGDRFRQLEALGGSSVARTMYKSA